MTQTEPLILCNRCYERLGYTKSLPMGKAGRENCDLCHSKLEEYHWVYGIENVRKTREEQDREFRETIGQYASPNCKYCLGTGKEHWIVELEQYKPCECVLRNISIQRELNERKN